MERETCEQRKLTSKDVVVGIAASGTTPYVLGAMEYARKRRATTVALTSNRRSPMAKLAEIVIAPEVGPEVVTGSTRLKAGTSQKLVLNMLSTASMVRLGHVYENLMIDVMLTNEKLRGRAKRILAEASGKDLSVGGTRYASVRPQSSRRSRDAASGTRTSRKLASGLHPRRAILRRALGE